MSNRTRLQVGEYKRSIYYQLPKYLIHDPEFKGKIRGDTIVLYTLLLDRLRMSLRNKWVDDKGHVYLIMSRREMMELTSRSESTVTRMMQQLTRLKLLEEHRTGLGKPNLIYITAPTNPVIEPLEDTSRTVKQEVPDPATQQFENRHTNAPVTVTEAVASYNKNEGSKNYVSEKLTPTQKIFGERFQRVLLTETEYALLVNTYGKETAVDYINRLDTHIKSKGDKYRNHSGTICEWIDKDKREAAEKEKAVDEKAKPRPSRFVNYQQPAYDFAEIERLEREHLNNKLAYKDEPPTAAAQ